LLEHVSVLEEPYRVWWNSHMSGTAKPVSAPARTETPDPEDVFGERLLTTDQVARIFGTAEATIRDWIGRGELPAVKWGKRHYVSVSTLRETKEAKEGEQRRQSDLIRRQQREPNLHWNLTYCVACGIEPLLTTRHRRLDGQAACESCGQENRLTKDGWERKVSLLVAELNAMTGGEPPEWLLHHCGSCGKPQDVERSRLKDDEYMPWCDHAHPFKVQYAWEGVDGDLQPIEVLKFAELAASELARSEPDYAWAVSRCARCGEVCAISTLEMRLIGATACRLCARKNVAEDDSHRADVVSEALVEIGEQSLSSSHTPIDSDAYVSRRQSFCRCHGWEITDKNETSVILSWCKERPVEERRNLASEYAKALSLSGTAARKLRLRVSATKPSETPF
jgi:excisionase family DNA binding protein